MFFLLVRDSGREPAVRIEAQDGIEIGRSPDSQCVLTDPNVGRKAAKIVEDHGVFYVEDMGSTNRTSLRGGRKLAKGEREPLRAGLVIELGRSSVEIGEDRAASDEQTNAGDATNADETGFGEATMLASPSSFGARPPKSAPRPESDDMANTLVGKSPPAPPPAPTPAPPKRPAPVAQQPAPVVRQAPPPQPAPKPVPTTDTGPSSSTSDFLGPGGIGSGTQSIRPLSGDLGALGAMITRRPRLVIVNEADRRIVPIERMVTMIGRESGDCRIDHKAISQPHAMIRFISATNNFQIEDRKSRNQTFVGGLALNPNAPQLLSPECLVRFGPIEAVFVVDRDGENVPIPAAQYAGALRYLQAQNQATPEQIRTAQEDAKQSGRHVGESLMVAGVISARVWTKAFENGQSMAQPAGSLPSGRRALVMIVIGVVVVGLVLAWLFRTQLGFGPK